ncbi:EF-P lysine aminoacylase GenX [Leucothrix sargassi]|nr:EF-P lysine aminoacylase GenX [Leucothrix sargassi]
MQWQPDGDQKSRIARAAMLRDIREFFYQRQVLEVETPALSQAANTDPYIDSFSLSNQQRYLHTSPEYAMKRLLASGSGDIYQICKVWRSEPSAKHHNAEFTMLEFYRVAYDLEQLMAEVDALLTELLPSLKKPSQFTTYADLFLDNLGINPHTVSVEELKACVDKQVPEFQGELDHQGYLDLLLTHCIEPKLATDRISFIYDYPATQSALAQTESMDDYSVAKRFEVYVGSLELGNGYQELTSYHANAEVLHKETSIRQQSNFEVMPIDERFLSAMQAGLPECAGIAIGVDRLLMLKTGANNIKQVLNFSWENA